MPFRRSRFLLAGCPLFLYSAKRVREILNAAGVVRYEWIEFDRDVVVVASSPESSSQASQRVV